MLEPFLSSKTSLHQQNENIIVLWIHFTRFLFCMLATGAVTVFMRLIYAIGMSQTYIYS